ncbi:GNAT family N-acetyltransferase, partial [Nostoc sp. NIES-2111]
MVTVTDLRDRPEFAPVVADRVWRAWWKPKGYPLSFIEGMVSQNLGNSPIPLALVAHNGTAFLGTASVIESDLDLRPQFTPWIAALWVDPSHRENGVGSALVRTGVEAARSRGATNVYV